MQLSAVIGNRLNKSNEQIQALQVRLHNLTQKRKKNPESTNG